MSKDRIEFPHCEAQVSVLDNGLELLIKPDHRSPVVSLQAWVKTGSIHEGDWMGAGLSHFLEHMLFKGTSRRDANQIAQEIQAQGGYVNAYTSFERTVYWIDAPSSGFAPCLDVLCDVVADSQLPADEFDSEQDVIRREFSMGDDNPDQVLSKLLFYNTFAEHPCRHPVIGHLDLFNQLTRDDLVAYYQQRYTPDNMFLVIVGDVDPVETREMVEKHLGHLKRRKRPLLVLPDEPRQLGERVIHETFPTDMTRLQMAWRTPDIAHPDMPALDLLSTIVGGGRSSRLYRNIREELQLAHAVGAYSYTPSHEGLFIVSGETPREKRDDLIEAIHRQVDLWKTGGVTKDELDKAVHQTLSSQLSTLTSMRGQASDLGSNWLHARNPDFTRDYVAAVQQVIPEDLSRVAEHYLVRDSLTTISLNPQEKVAAVKRSGAGSQKGEVTKVELENGLTVLLMNDPSVPLVHTTGMFRGGLLGETETNNGVNRLMARLLTKDTAKHSAEELAEMIESVGGGISSSFGNNTFGVNCGVMRSEIDLAIDLLGETLLEPSFLEEALERERAFQISQIKTESDRPFTVAMQELRKRLFPSHSYGLPGSGTESSVAGLTRPDVMALREKFVLGGNGVAAVFGDIGDPARIEDLIRQRFSEMPSGPRAFSEVTGLSPVDAGEFTCYHEKEQAIHLIGFRTGGVTDPDRRALELLDEACSDMASRIFIRIREELGLAYSVGASRMVGYEAGYFLFYVATAPEHIERVQEEMFDQIKVLRRDGLAADEFERAKASYLGSELIGHQSPRELAGSCAVDELVGLGWNHYQKTPDEICAVTRERVQEVAERILVDDSRVVVRLTTGGE